MISLWLAVVKEPRTVFPVCCSLSWLVLFAAGARGCRCALWVLVWFISPWLLPRRVCVSVSVYVCEHAWACVCVCVCVLSLFHVFFFSIVSSWSFRNILLHTLCILVFAWKVCRQFHRISSFDLCIVYLEFCWFCRCVCVCVRACACVCVCEETKAIAAIANDSDNIKRTTSTHLLFKFLAVVMVPIKTQNTAVSNWMMWFALRSRFICFLCTSMCFLWCWHVPGIRF